jgi:hypothetical protein
MESTMSRKGVKTPVPTVEPRAPKRPRRFTDETARKAYWADVSRRYRERHPIRSRASQLGLDPETIPPIPDTCDFCHKPFSQVHMPGSRSSTNELAPSIDHDHATNLFRGWVHFKCNRVLIAGHDVHTTRALVEYIGRSNPDYLIAFQARQQQIQEERAKVYSQEKSLLIEWDAAEREWLAAIEARILRIRLHTRSREVAGDSLIDIGNYCALMFDHMRKTYGMAPMTSEEFQASDRAPAGAP